LTAEQAAREVYGTSERTFHNMRAAGLVPAPVVLGPRLLRWVRSELESAVLQMPRQLTPQGEPKQLQRRRGRIGGAE
jgi:predicted DNA-binding transcriptional regulator AlpA